MYLSVTDLITIHSLEPVLLVSTLLPPFTGHKMFWAGPNFLCQTKNLFTYCASHKNFVPDKKDDLHSVKFGFCAGTKVYEEALNAVKFLG